MLRTKNELMLLELLQNIISAMDSNQGMPKDVTSVCIRTRTAGLHGAHEKEMVEMIERLVIAERNGQNPPYYEAVELLASISGVYP